MALKLIHEYGTALNVECDEQQILRYVYEPWDAQLESPRPYFHPLYTLGGDPVSLYRPHDHVWHKGIALSLPNIRVPGGGTENFWGGVTYLRDREYVQLPNNGAMRHTGFDWIEAEPDGISVGHGLDWLTERGTTWFREARSFVITADPAESVWALAFATRFTNVSGQDLAIGSPTTEGRVNAGYGGLFWRGPRSFSGGTVYVPGLAGGDELMGVRAPWLAFTGRHDEHGRESTLAFVDAPDNPGHPVEWFVRSGIFACVCPAPFFSAEVPVPAGEAIELRYAVVIADGDPGLSGAGKLAELGRAALSDFTQRVGPRLG